MCLIKETFSLWSITNMSVTDNVTFWHHQPEKITFQAVYHMSTIVYSIIYFHTVRTVLTTDQLFRIRNFRLQIDPLFTVKGAVSRYFLPTFFACLGPLSTVCWSIFAYSMVSISQRYCCVQKKLRVVNLRSVKYSVSKLSSAFFSHLKRQFHEIVLTVFSWF